MGNLLLKKWKMSSAEERNQCYLRVKPLFFETVKVLSKKALVPETFELIRCFTKYLEKVDAFNKYINVPFSYFINFSSTDDLLELTRTTILKESLPLSEIKSNGYLSGLIFMIYLQVQTRLNYAEKASMLVRSMISMDRFKSGLRLDLRKRLILKC